MFAVMVFCGNGFVQIDRVDRPADAILTLVLYMTLWTNQHLVRNWTPADVSDESARVKSAHFPAAVASRDLRASDSRWHVLQGEVLYADTPLDFHPRDRRGHGGGRADAEYGRSVGPRILVVVDEHGHRPFRHAIFRRHRAGCPGCQLLAQGFYQTSPSPCAGFSDQGVICSPFNRSSSRRTASATCRAPPERRARLEHALQRRAAPDQVEMQCSDDRHRRWCVLVQVDTSVDDPQQDARFWMTGKSMTFPEP